MCSCVQTRLARSSISETIRRLPLRVGEGQRQGDCHLTLSPLHFHLCVCECVCVNVCLCNSTRMMVIGQLVGAGSWGWNSGCQTLLLI